MEQSDGVLPSGTSGLASLIIVPVGGTVDCYDGMVEYHSRFGHFRHSQAKAICAQSFGL